MTVYLSLGSNLGDRRTHLANAVAAINQEGVQVVRGSSLYETAPREKEDQPWFLNQVLEASTELTAEQLLERMLAVELAGGRDRITGEWWGPRVIDVDILLYGDEVIETPRLQVPHPRLFERRFVLEPLLELAPELVDPRSGLPMEIYLMQVRDQEMRRMP